jgi:uncharacterized membrane protein
MLLSYLPIAHIVLIAFFLGGQFYYLFITQPASYGFFSVNDQIRFLQNVLKRQNPVLLLALCLVVLTGGFMITPLKGAYGADYFGAFGGKLITKLGFFFVVFFVSAYQTLAVGFKIRYLDPARVTGQEENALGRVRLHMTVTSILNIVFTIITIHYGMRLT